MRRSLAGAPTRRTFLTTTAAGGTGLAALVAGRAGAQSANDTIGIGLIGAGVRGTFHRDELLRIGGTHNAAVVAVCDVWRPAADAAAAAIATATGKAPRTGSRYGELLARDDVDAVIITTPDFSHGPILCEALEAGKDVYIEKPMTIDVELASRAVDLAAQRERIVQVGTQRRSDGGFRAGARAIAEGALGTLSRIQAGQYFHEPRWNRPTDDMKADDVDWPAFLLHLDSRPFDPRLLRCWQLFRATSNGLPGLWMTHFADAVHFLTGATYPSTAVASGGIYVWKDGREHADTFQAVLEYPEGFQFSWGMNLGNAAGSHFHLHGTEATLDADHWTLTPERRGGGGPRALGREPGVSHLANWLDCLRSRATPNAPIVTGHQHVVATMMAARALETGRRQRYLAAERRIVDA